MNQWVAALCNGQYVEVRATLCDADEVDRLIPALEALKPLLPTVEPAQLLPEQP